MSPGEDLAITVARLDERQKSHSQTDEEVHGRMLGELGELGNKVDAVSRKVADLDKRFEVFTETLKPVVEHYLAEHPSRATSLPHTPVPPSKRSSAIGDMARTYGPMGGIILALQIIAELVKALLAQPRPAPPPVQPPTAQAAHPG